MLTFTSKQSNPFSLSVGSLSAPNQGVFPASSEEEMGGRRSRSHRLRGGSNRESDLSNFRPPRGVWGENRMGKEEFRIGAEVEAMPISDTLKHGEFERQKTESAKREIVKMEEVSRACERYVATPWYGGEGVRGEDSEVEQQREKGNLMSLSGPLGMRWRSPGSSPGRESADSDSEDEKEAVGDGSPSERYCGDMHRGAPASTSSGLHGVQKRLHCGERQQSSSDMHSRSKHTAQATRRSTPREVESGRSKGQMDPIVQSHPASTVGRVRPPSNVTVNQYYNPVWASWWAPVSGATQMQTYGQPPGFVGPRMTRSAPASIVDGESPTSISRERRWKGKLVVKGKGRRMDMRIHGIRIDKLLNW